jgi:hypothetical protein
VEAALGAFAGVGAGLAPGPTAEVGGAAALYVEWLRVAVDGRYATSGDRAVAPRSRAAARYRLWGFALRFGPVARAGRFEWVPSGGLELGRLLVDPVALRDPRPARDLWLAPAVGLRAAYQATRGFVLFLGLDAAVPLLRPRYRVDPHGEIHRLAPMTAQGHLGVEVRFR